MRTTRRGVRRRAVLVGAAALPLLACAPSGPDDTGGPTRRVQHRWGVTAVPAQPTRVVALGLGDLETAIALGVAPVGGSDVFGGRDEVRPWASAALTGPPPVLLDWRDPPLERIAALRPDVILYTNAPGDRRVYDVLSRVAPTVAGPAGSATGLGVAWQEQVGLVGETLGLATTADRVVADVEGLVRAERERHPGLARVRARAGIVVDGIVHLWPTIDPRVRLLRDLGLQLDGQPARPSNGSGGYLVPVSPERYDLLEADLLYLACTDGDGRVDAGLLVTPTFAALDVVRRDRVVYAPGPAAVAGSGALSDYASAFGTGGPLGIPACLPRLVDDLVRASRAG